MLNHDLNQDGAKHQVPDWFSAPTHPVPREPGRPGTVISGVCTDVGK
jgi:hypothetical protein